MTSFCCFCINQLLFCLKEKFTTKSINVPACILKHTRFVSVNMTLLMSDNRTNKVSLFVTCCVSLYFTYEPEDILVSHVYLQTTDIRIHQDAPPESEYFTVNRKNNTVTKHMFCFLLPSPPLHRLHCPAVDMLRGRKTESLHVRNPGCGCEWNVLDLFWLVLLSVLKH